jgi:hypothetical protein
MFNFVKINQVGSLRSHGEMPSGIPPHKLPIAGKKHQPILSAMKCKGFKIKGISVKNAFVAHGGNWIYYLFVRPKYTLYRKLAKLRYGNVDLNQDVDHILARNLAQNLGFNYILLCLVSKKVNRSHGYFEKYFQKPAPRFLSSQVCYLDNRIFDKILDRRAKTRRTVDFPYRGYGVQNKIDLGLTLKQKGIWNISFGFHQPPPANFISSLEPL